MVGEFAGRIDAWLLAEGIETPAELAAFVRLGVPLGAGLAAGPPGARSSPRSPPRSCSWCAPQAARARLTETVAQPAAAGAPGAPARRAVGVPPAVLVGPLGEPLALLLADPGPARSTRPRCRCGCTRPPTSRETLQRALTRPPAHRFDPVGLHRPDRRTCSACCASRTSPAPAAAARPHQTPVRTRGRSHTDPPTRSPSHEALRLRRRHPRLQRHASPPSDEAGIFTQVAGHAAADHGLTEVTPELVADGPR